MVKKITERTPFGARMFESRKKSGLSQEVVCKRIGCAQATLSELERLYESSGLTPQFADLYKVNPKWLATGKGDRTAISKHTETKGPSNDSAALTKQEEVLLDAYRKQQNEEVKNAALNLLKIGVNALSNGEGHTPARKKTKTGTHDR